MTGTITADTETTGMLNVGEYTNGRIEERGDQDWFAVTLEAGVTYRVDIARTDGRLNTRLEGIYDSTGTLIPNTARESGGDWREEGSTYTDARSFFTPDEDGTYYISASGGLFNTTGAYRIRVTDNWDDYAADTTTTGELDRIFFLDGRPQSGNGVTDWSGDKDWFAFQATAGQAYNVLVNPSDFSDDSFLYGIYDATGAYVPGTRDDNSAQNTTGAQTGFTATETGTYYVSAGLINDAPSDPVYSIAVFEDDYTADIGTAGRVTVGGTAQGRIELAGDRDWFATTLEAGKDYTMIFDPGDRPGTIHSIRDADGVRFANSSDTKPGFGGEAPVVEFTAPEDGTYYLDVTARKAYTDYTVQVTTDDYADDTSTQGRAFVGGTVRGNLEYEGDEDWIAVDLEAGETYAISARGAASMTGSLNDPLIYSIRDANGAHIPGSSDDNGGQGRDALSVITADTTGTYYIDVRQGPASSTGSSYEVGVERVVDDFAADITTTGIVTPGVEVTGEVDLPAETDWFAVEFTQGAEYRIDVLGASTGDGTLERTLLAGIFDDQGVLEPFTVVARGGTGTNTSFVFTADETDTFHIAAGGHFNDTGTYALRVTERIELQGTDDDDWIEISGQPGVELSGVAAGNGTDTVSFVAVQSAVIIDLAADTFVLDGRSLPLFSVENATGSAFDDMFIGSDRAETMRGLGGDDLFFGSDGGRDVLDGGAGRDTASYLRAPDGVEVSLAARARLGGLRRG